MQLRFFSLNVMALVLGACDPCADLDGAAAAEVGTVDAAGAFAPLADGASVPYVRGIQGGTHVNASVRTTNVFFPEDVFLAADELPHMTLVLQDASGARVAGFEDQPQPLSVLGEPEQHRGERLGIEVRFDADGSEFVGQTLRLLLEMKDTCDAQVTDERSTIIAEGG
ncbi:MAG: hypothetical protein IT382_11515 [Deltaproteobacteria bacterium]|nr:hypothetical protein [Deltaproteobacteria bacterium]